jgi:hypothetical protein
MTLLHSGGKSETIIATVEVAVNILEEIYAQVAAPRPIIILLVLKGVPSPS